MRFLRFMFFASKAYKLALKHKAPASVFGTRREGQPPYLAVLVGVDRDAWAVKELLEKYSSMERIWED